MGVGHVVRKHHVKVLWVIVAALLLGNVGGFAGGYLAHDSIKRALGAKRDSLSAIRSHWLRIDPARVRLSGGGAGVIDLSYLFGPVGNQGDTNACGSFSLTADLYALRIQRGEVPSTYFSAWFHRYNTVGGTDGYTTMDDNINAAASGGMVYHWRQEQPGQPSSAEYGSAAAKSVSYQVFSTGGAATFDNIRYELSLGHPVWILNEVRDGLWYLNGNNPYTDNSGTYHGAHFEVAVGVYGDYIKVRNSWGQGYGQSGYYYMSRAGINNTTLEAAIVTVGPAIVWPVIVVPTPKPTVRPVARPTATPTIKRHPTPTPTPKPRHVRPRPVQRALAPLGHRAYRVTVASWLRSNAGPSSRRVVAVPTGQTVYNAGRFTPHWLLVRYHGRVGWKLRDQLR